MDFSKNTGNTVGTGNTGTNPPVLCMPVSGVPHRSMPGQSMPGQNGRGAILTCSKCGNRYADTGIGCPVCNANGTPCSN